jgi:hypothetical protein
MEIEREPHENGGERGKIQKDRWRFSVVGMVEKDPYWWTNR